MKRKGRKLPFEAKVSVVEWADAVGHGGWHPLSQALAGRPSLMITVGVILHNDKHKLIMVSSFGEDVETVGDTTVIPKGMVRRIVELGVVEFGEDPV
jgi:hypothetical protein